MKRLIGRLIFWRSQEPGPYKHPDEVWADTFRMFGRVDDPLEFAPVYEMTPCDLIERICQLHEERERICAELKRAKAQLDILADLDP